MKMFKHANTPNAKCILKVSRESDRKIKAINVLMLTSEARAWRRRSTEIVPFKYIQRIT